MSRGRAAAGAVKLLHAGTQVSGAPRRPSLRGAETVHLVGDCSFVVSEPSKWTSLWRPGTHEQPRRRGRALLARTHRPKSCRAGAADVRLNDAMGLSPAAELVQTAVADTGRTLVRLPGREVSSGLHEIKELGPAFACVACASRHSGETGRAGSAHRHDDLESADEQGRPRRLRADRSS